MSKFETAILSQADIPLAEPRGPILEALVATGRGYGTGGSYMSARAKTGPPGVQWRGHFFSYLSTCRT